MKVGVVKMPYIDSTPALSPYKVREGTLQNDFKNLLIKHGWTKALEFKKAVTSVHFVTEHDQTARHDDKFTVANHVIMRNARGDLLGIAVVADWQDYTDHTQGFPFFNWFTSTTTEKDDLIDYMVTEFEKRKTNTTLYFYMVEKLPNVTEGETLFTPWGLESEDDKRLRMALDVEVIEIDFKSTNAGSEYVKVANPSVMQSPIVEAALRAPFVESIDYPYMDTNWWADSEVSIKGHVDSNNIFVVIQTDNTPMWENNLVPIVPLYFGDIIPMDEGDHAIALFAGTVPQGANATAIATFNFDDVTVKGGKQIMPILKTYPSNPSNGIDSVIVNRTKLGARYQSYFLSWNTAPQDMPPERLSDDGSKQYPRSWNEIKKYQFNPSRYSGKVQTSRVYLVHPEEGVRGYLKKAVGLNTANLNTSELRIRKDACPDTIYDVYQCVPVSAVSPLTKRPATHYRPMGLGLYKEELNVDNPFVFDPNDTTPPADVTNLTATSPAQGVVKLSWKNPTDNDFTSVKILVGTNEYVVGVTEVEEYVLTGLASGSATIKVVAVDKAGNESTGVTVDVTVL